MIAIESLTPDDIALVDACLKAAVHGPFFPEWEFETLFGLSREQVKDVVKGWPHNAADPETELAVQNAIANLLGYPHGQSREFENMVSVSVERVRDLWDKVKSE